jgi:hypothetical protein
VLGDWKLANVCPIYKGKGGSDSVANYRPMESLCLNPDWSCDSILYLN